MLATAAPHEPPPGLMSVDAAAFGGFDLHVELRRLLWVAVAVLCVVLYLSYAVR
jgi:hypothetical protein